MAKGDWFPNPTPRYKTVNVRVSADGELIAGAECYVVIGENTYQWQTQGDGVAPIDIPRNATYGIVKVIKDGYHEYEGGYELPNHDIIVPITLEKIPAPPSEIPLPERHLLDWREDFINVKTPQANFSGHFILMNEDEQDEVIRMWRDRKYDDLHVETVHRPSHLDPFFGYDLFTVNPQIIRDGLTKLRKWGIRPHAFIGFAGKTNWTPYAPMERYISNQVIPFVNNYKDLFCTWSIGVEVLEYWNWDEIHLLMHEIGKQSSLPISVHMRQTEWGPNSDTPWSGGGEMSWWRKAKQLCPSNELGLNYQFRHRGSDSFLATDYELIEDTKALTTGRLDTIDVKFIAGEYAFNVPEMDGQRAGDLAMLNGAFGFMNGGS